jgi:peptidoglycan/LPS O-acetylase OafA/YrhL
MVIVVVLVVVFQKYILPNEYGTILYILRPTIISLLFCILISIFLPENSSIKIKSKLLSFLGVRGYGLYVYHIIFIHCGFQYCITENIKIDNWLIIGAFIIFTLGGTIILSSISYKYFEMPFLAFREKKYFN